MGYSLLLIATPSGCHLEDAPMLAYPLLAGGPASPEQQRRQPHLSEYESGISIADLSPTVAWRVPESLQIVGPNLLNNTCGDNQVNIYAANIRLTLLVTIDDIQLHSSCLH